MSVDHTPDVVDQIVDLYSESGMSTRRIAEIMQIDRQRVTQILCDNGIAVAPRGVGRTRPLRVPNVISKNDLEYLYTTQRMSSVEIGRVLGLSDRFIRSRLKLWRIERRTKGALNRYDRQEVDTGELTRLYLEKEWAASVVSEELGTSLGIVLRSAHSSGLAIRAGGSPRPSPSYDIHLIEALYDDSEVEAILTFHKIQVVRSPGPIWVRFPTPAALTEELLTALYCECGLAIFHIELLTGAPASTILHKLEEYGIDRRGRGGLSPFMQRWRAKQKTTAIQGRWSQSCV
ncbi:MAG: hypothetical protein PXZ08_07520 [Actinomycetota bacterium]|nr:hypothetical protein [Actinomycetota bacterium]NNN09397.1 hypothetical protein [Acidimicrobiaceae bacterium]